MSSEYVRQAVSKPNEIGIYGSTFKSPSIVFGAPQTFVLQLCASKYSARTAPFVFESSPPMTTMPEREERRGWGGRV